MKSPFWYFCLFFYVVVFRWKRPPGTGNLLTQTNPSGAENPKMSKMKNTMNFTNRSLRYLLELCYVLF